MHELSKSFTFEAAHTLRREIETEGSARIHGHSYRATVTLRGEPDAQSGMLLDLGFFNQALQQLHAQLDHCFLDDVPGLAPATLERLCVFIWNALEHQLPGLARVAVGRDSTYDQASYSKLLS